MAEVDGRAWLATELGSHCPLAVLTGLNAQSLVPVPRPGLCICLWGSTCGGPLEPGVGPARSRDVPASPQSKLFGGAEAALSWASSLPGPCPPRPSTAPQEKRG